MLDTIIGSSSAYLWTKPLDMATLCTSSAGCNNGIFERHQKVMVDSMTSWLHSYCKVSDTYRSVPSCGDIRTKISVRRCDVSSYEATATDPNWGAAEREIIRNNRRVVPVDQRLTKPYSCDPRVGTRRITFFPCLSHPMNRHWNLALWTNNPLPKTFRIRLCAWNTLDKFVTYWIKRGTHLSELSQVLL